MRNMGSDPRNPSRRSLLRGFAAAGVLLRVAGLSHSVTSFAKERAMRRVFITASTDGLGLAAARTLMSEGHQVVLHARSAQRATVLGDVAHRSAGVVIGDLRSAGD